AKIDRLLSETPDKPSPVRLSGGKKESRLRPKQPNQRSAPHRAALPPGGHAYPRRPPASSGHHARTCIMRRTSHSTARKKSKRAVFGIRRILISCNLRTRRSVRPNLIGIPGTPGSVRPNLIGIPRDPLKRPSQRQPP